MALKVTTFGNLSLACHVVWDFEHRCIRIRLRLRVEGQRNRLVDTRHGEALGVVKVTVDLRADAQSMTTERRQSQTRLGKEAVRSNTYA
jgi:hypothetical protein